MNANQPVSELMGLINGYQISQMIHVAATLGVADLFKDMRCSSAEIAGAAGAHPASMYRLLHALASVGVLDEHVNAHFSLTSVGQCLRSDSPNSRAAWARYVGRPYSGNPGAACCIALRRARTHSATCTAAEYGTGAPSGPKKVASSMLL